MEKKIIETWKQVEKSIENSYILSSEKTLVFLFSLEFMKLNNCKFEKFELDFEHNIYNEIDSSDTFLDLMIKDMEENKKYGLEFKFPRKSSNGNSNQTVTREKVYRDIARLKYITEYKNFEKGFFIMLTDEAPYINHSTRRDNTYDIPDGLTRDLENFKDKYRIKNHTFNFKWNKKNKYNYLDLITVS